MARNPNRRRFELQLHPEVERIVASWAEKWGGLPRTGVVERLLRYGDAIALYQEQHPPFALPELGGNVRQRWRRVPAPADHAASKCVRECDRCRNTVPRTPLGR
jgi:hypothetical protein